MGDPYKEQDPEKGQAAVQVTRPLIMERTKSIFSKAGNGITGTTLKDSDCDKMGSTKKSQKNEKKKTKKHKKITPTQPEEPKDTNIVGNITKLLPANTFLMFQILAPLATNDGKCGRTEIIMTSVTLLILASTCMLVCFTDTVQIDGKVYHGFVTWTGLWNPSFKRDPSFADLHLFENSLKRFKVERQMYKVKKKNARDKMLPLPPRPAVSMEPEGPYMMGSTYFSGNSQYKLNFMDFLHAALSALAFGTVTMLTNPVLACFYSKAPVSVVKTLPLLISFIISAIFAFTPSARNSIAHPLPPKAHTINYYKRPDHKEVVVQGPSLPPKPPVNHGDDLKPKPGDEDNHDDLGGSVMSYLGKLVGSPAHEERNSTYPLEHHKLDGLKAFASSFFSKHGADIKHGAATMAHGFEDDVKKEANQLLLKAAPAPAVAGFSKDIPVPQELQEAAKSVQYETLIAGLVNAGAHPTLAIAAMQSAAQGAKDAALNQIHQELQAVTFAPVAGLSKQSSLSLTRAGSLLQSAGSSLSLPSAHDAPDALFHQVAEALKLQNSGSPSNMHASGPDAAAIALATGQALMNAAYPLPGAGPSPQAAALNAFAQNVGNQPNLNSVKALMKDTTSLVHQGGKSLAEIHDELARQSAALTQGLNTQLQTLHFPSVSTNPGTQTLNKGNLAATLTAGVAREVGTLFQEGAIHGMAGVHAEIARQKAAALQSIMQPVSSLAQDAVSMGSQGLSFANTELQKEKEVWTHELTSQARALSIPATSVAQDLAALATTQAGSQLATQFQQPTASVAMDIASLLQQGSQMHAQLALQETSALSPQTKTAAAMLQHQASFGQFQQPSVIDSHMALLHLASRLSPPPASPEFGTSPVMSTSPPSWRDNTSLVIEEVTDAAAAGQRGADRLLRGASLLPSVTEELVTQAEARSPSASQVQPVSSETVACPLDAAAQAALASRRCMLRSDRPEPSEIVDSISMEEITSESETELSHRAPFQPSGSASSSSQGPVKRK